MARNHESAAGRPRRGEPVLRAYIETKGEPVFDLQLDASPFASFALSRDTSPPNVRSLLHRMASQGSAHSLQWGRWLISDEATTSPRLNALEPLADALLRRLNVDYYLSWHSALWHHGLLDQQSRTVYTAITTRKRPAQIGWWQVRFISITERKFFGGEQTQTLDWPVWVARPEKALLDAFDHPALAAAPAVVAQALNRGWRDGLVDPDRLVSDALRFDSPVLNRRVGFFMELFEIPGWEPLAQETGRRAVVPLAPGRDTQGPGGVVNRRWRVFEDPGIVGAAIDPK